MNIMQAGSNDYNFTHMSHEPGMSLQQSYDKIKANMAGKFSSACDYAGSRSRCRFVSKHKNQNQKLGGKKKLHSLYASLGPSVTSLTNTFVTQGTANTNSFTQLTNQHTREIPRSYNNKTQRRTKKKQLVLLNRLMNENKHTRTLSATAKLKSELRDRNPNKTQFSVLQQVNKDTNQTELVFNPTKAPHLNESINLPRRGSATSRNDPLNQSAPQTFKNNNITFSTAKISKN